MEFEDHWLSAFISYKPGGQYKWLHYYMNIDSESNKIIDENKSNSMLQFRFDRSMQVCECLKDKSCVLWFSVVTNVCVSGQKRTFDEDGSFYSDPRPPQMPGKIPHLS